MPASVLRQRGGPGAERHVDIRRLKELEAAGHDAHDGVGLVVELQRAPERLSTRELALGEGGAQERHTLRPWTVVRSVEAPPPLDGHAKQRQEASSNHLRGHALRVAGARDGDVQRTERGHSGERVRALAPGVVVVTSDGHRRKLRRLFLENDHVLRPLIGQRCQQHRVEDGEHRRVRPNPEREGHDGRRGKAGPLDEVAEGEAEILHLDSVPARYHPRLLAAIFPTDVSPLASG